MLTSIINKEDIFIGDFFINESGIKAKETVGDLLLLGRFSAGWE